MPVVLGADAFGLDLSVRALVKEVASRPKNPTVLYNFAATLERIGKDSLAALVYMRCLDFETEGSEEWAETVAAMCAPASEHRSPAPSRTSYNPDAPGTAPLTSPCVRPPSRFCKLIQPQCDGVPKPAWWDDAELLHLSQRVLEAAPQSPAVCVMRADVLAGPSAKQRQKL